MIHSLVLVIFWGHLFLQTVNTPMVLRRFLQLKYLEIELFTPNYSPDYDFYSLVSFLDASPALETFILRVSTHLSLYKL